jgi:hypothetical protein
MLVPQGIQHLGRVDDSYASPTFSTGGKKQAISM